MTLWTITGIIVLAGILGGVINALLSDSGFILPGSDEVEGKRIWKPGVLGNMVFGAAAAFISWGLYGPFSQYVLIPPSTTADNSAYLALETLVGALLVGIGGSRVITSELEKRTLTTTAATAQAAPADPVAAAAIATASSPTEALRTAMEAAERMPSAEAPVVRAPAGGGTVE
jgi:hypothetical protein